MGKKMRLQLNVAITKDEASPISFFHFFSFYFKSKTIGKMRVGKKIDDDKIKKEEDMKYTVRITKEEYEAIFSLKELYQKDIQLLLRRTVWFFLKNPENLKDLKTFLIQNLNIKKGKSKFISFNKELLIKAFNLFYQNLKNDVFPFDEIKILSKTPLLSGKQNKALPFFTRLVISYLIKNHEKILKEEAL